MFSLFQLFSVLFVLFLLLCAYIGRKANMRTGEISSGFKDVFESKENKGVLHFVTVWLGYTLLGFTKVFDIFTVLFQKQDKTEPPKK